MNKLAKVVFGSFFGTVAMGSIVIGATNQSSDPQGARGNAGASGTPSPVLPAPMAQPENDTVISSHASADEQLAGCKVALALMNDRDVSIFSGHRLDRDTVHVKWRSPDDGKQWEARCQKAGGNSMRWAAYNAFGDGRQGRWRDEDTIKTEVEGERIVVELTQSGLGAKRASYALSELS